MIIKRLKTTNYRSLEDLEINFNPYYNALSGKNNCGKSNIIRALLSFLSYDLRLLREYPVNGIHFQNDYPYWKKKEKIKEKIEIEIEVELDENFDAGLFKFLKELIFKNETDFNNSKENLKIVASLETEPKELKIKIQFGQHEITDEYKREELLNRLRGSSSVLFHNSTENEPAFFSRGRRDTLISYIGKDDRTEVTKRKESLENEVKKLLKKHQNDFSSLLGRLDEKYH